MDSGLAASWRPGMTLRRLRPPACRHCPASVATSFQFGSREEASRAKVHTSVTSVTVSALPSFAARWLVPRLGRFRQQWPDIDLRIDPSAELYDFSRGDVDVAIRYGRGKYPGLRTHWLMTEDIFPVCSPTLLEGHYGLRDPRDLENHVLLHDDGHGDWRTWLLAAGVVNVDPARGPIFTDSGMLIQAAMTGQGVALARGVLAADELAAGRLVRPLTLSLPTEYAYYFVCPEDTAEQPKIAAFREWLLAESKGEATG